MHEIFLSYTESELKIEKKGDLFPLPGVKTDIWLVSPPEINEFKREPFEVRVHLFPKDYRFCPPCQRNLSDYDPGPYFEHAFLQLIDSQEKQWPGELITDLLEGQLDPELIRSIFSKDLSVADLAALPGASAADKKRDNMTVIKKLTDPAWGAFAFPAEKQNFGLAVPDLGIAVGFQPNEHWFNDGAAYFSSRDNLFLDYPLQSLRKLGLIRQGPFRRVFLGQKNDGSLAGFLTENEGNRLEDELLRNGFQFAFSNSIAYIANDRLTPLSELLGQSNGDPRHVYEIPYHSKFGPVGLEVFAHTMRMSPEKLSSALIERQPVTLKLSQRAKQFTPAEVIEAFSQDKRYGERFAQEIVFSEDEWQLPYLQPATYNHLLTGITAEGQLVLIQTGGRLGERSGQNGPTKTELISIVSHIQKETPLLWLIGSCHGRDVDNIVTLENGKITDHTPNPDSSFNASKSVSHRGPVTSPRIWIGRK